MLVTDVGDDLGHFGHPYPLSFHISAGRQHSKDFTNIDNTTMSPTSLSSLQKYLSSGFSEDDSVQIGEIMKWSLELEPVILRYSR